MDRNRNVCSRVAGTLNLLRCGMRAIGRQLLEQGRIAAKADRSGPFRWEPRADPERGGPPSHKSRESARFPSAADELLDIDPGGDEDAEPGRQ